MDFSQFKFTTQSFTIDNEQSNPEMSSFQKKKEQSQLTFGKNSHQNGPTAKNIMLHDLFAQDQSESDQSVQQQQEEHKIGRIKRNTSSGRKVPLPQKSFNEQYSPKTIELLQNCKMSILSLQQQLNQKNQIIKKLEKQKQSLSVKLTEAEKQIQRTHLILNIYLKENHQKLTPILTQNANQHIQPIIKKQFSPNNLSLSSQIEKLKQLNENYIQQNTKLISEISLLQTEVSQLKTENVILNQKLQTIGKGVGKALSTIKKNNESNRKITQFILVQQQTNIRKSREYGKISTVKSHRKTTEQSFETPTKVSVQNTQESTNQISIKSFYESSQQKMADISIKAKRLDQLEKLQSILEKMQTLAQKDSQSQNQSN